MRASAYVLCQLYLWLDEKKKERGKTMQGVSALSHVAIVVESLGNEGSLGEELALLFDDLAADVDLDGEFGSVLRGKNE